MTITIENKEDLTNKVKGFLLEQFLNSLEGSDLDQEEKDANVVLARKKIQADADNIATLVYKVYGVE